MFSFVLGVDILLLKVVCYGNIYLVGSTRWMGVCGVPG